MSNSSERLAAIDAAIDAKLENYLADLGRLVAQPSVAAQGRGIAECAELTAAILREQGFKPEILATGGSPVVYAAAEGDRSDRTLLFYNHYDVQPPEPLE